MTESRGYLFEGADRIEYWETAGRTTRMGSLAELGVSDVERVRAAFANRDGPAARAYLEYLHPLYIDMNTSYIEWALTWPAFVAERLSEEDAHLISVVAYEAWHRVITAIPRPGEDEGIDLLLGLLDPCRVEPGSIEAFRHRQATVEWPVASAVNELPMRSFEEVLCAIAADCLFEAAEIIEAYIVQVRSRHDLLAKYAWAYCSAVNRAHGQGLAEQGMQCSLARCAFYGAMWDLVARMSPIEISALLAEELRVHFSGADRQGAVEIIEESSYYRLVFDPCGGGGAMRRDAEGISEGFAVFSKSSPATWGRAGDVPAYCAHCAQNELTSLKRLGYPAWVTEFDADASKPCGWTVYKNPIFIPEYYFTRLGVDKDPSKFHE